MISLSDYNASPISNHFSVSKRLLYHEMSVDGVQKSHYVRIRNGKLEQVNDSRVRHEIEVKPRANYRTKEGIDTLLRTGTYGIISAGRNTNSQIGNAMCDEDIAKREPRLKEDLQSLNLPLISVKGFWKGDDGKISNEHSFIIPNISRDKLIELGKKYNQDSVIFGSNNKHEYVFTTGDNAGKHYKGEGFNTNPSEEAYTEVGTKGEKYRFALNLNFDTLHKG